MALNMVRTSPTTWRSVQPTHLLEAVQYITGWKFPLHHTQHTWLLCCPWQVLQAAVEQYKQRHESEQIEPDEMIISAGDYLMHVLQPVQQQLDRCKCILVAAACLTVAVGAGYLAGRLWSSRSSSSNGIAASVGPASSNNSSRSSKC